LLKHGLPQGRPLESRTRRLRIELPPDAPVIGQTLRELHLPESCIITAIFRQNQIVIPRGDTRLAAGDRLEVLVDSADAEHVEQLLTQPRSDPTV
jgi:Trk K+ transport system NAD-binding subunit